MGNQDVTGVFKNRKRARKALVHLLSSGVSRSDVHITMPDDEFLGSAQFKLQSKISIVATTSAAVGGIVGALAANIPNIAPVLATILGVSLGILVGGIIGSLVGAELTERDSQEMAAADKDNFLLRVHTNGNEKNVEKILKHDGAISVKQAS